MAPPTPLARAALPLALALAVATAGVGAPVPKPKAEPDEGPATPAVDLDKAKTDLKLAEQVARDLKASRRNLSQIGIAVHEYHDAYRRLPADFTDKAGKPLLSWRVALLPYLSQGKLYKEFKLSEPWDSKHNKKLLEKMPDVYRSPRVKVKAKGGTVYQAFTGPEAVLGRAGGALSLVGITDGTSNTIFAVEASDGVPWTKPGGLPFDRKKDLPDLGKAYGKRPLAVLLDGSPRVLDLTTIKPETLKNAIDPMDGNVLGPDWR